VIHDTLRAPNGARRTQALPTASREPSRLPQEPRDPPVTSTSTDPSSSPLALALRTRDDWGRIRKEVLVFAVKKARSPDRAQDLAHEAIADFFARLAQLEVRADDPREDLVAFIEAEVTRVHDRQRKRFATTKRLEHRLLDALYAIPPEMPDQQLTEAEEQARWNDFLTRTAELAGDLPCARHLAAAVIAGEDDPGALAREAGFSQKDLNYARQHLRRVSLRVARQMNIAAQPAKRAPSEPSP
jgi:hypothetical protein